MAREELISSADPSVSSASLDKKIAFLQSKNLTQEEIDISLGRVGESTSSAALPANQPVGYPQQHSGYRLAGSPVNPAYGYGPNNQWQLAPPQPEVPKRDWRDWFIMATVMGGVGYGLYFVAKRYITPLIAPPTPPQLQQDKADIDEQFSRAFALLDQLGADTASLKAAEDARSERLDSALRDVEDVVSELKASSRRRDEETRRIGEEVRSLKDGIPKAIEGAREGNENRLKELNTELRSLKVLLGNRLGSPAATTTTTSRPTSVESVSSPGANGTSSTSQPAASVATATPIAHPSTSLPARETSTSPFSSIGRPAASIPAWQMAAAKKPNTSEDATSNSNPSLISQLANTPPS